MNTAFKTIYCDFNFPLFQRVRLSPVSEANQGGPSPTDGSPCHLTFLLGNLNDLFLQIEAIEREEATRPH